MLLYIGRLVLLRFSIFRAAVGVVAFDIDVGVSLDSALGASSVIFVLPVSAGSTAPAMPQKMIFRCAAPPRVL